MTRTTKHEPLSAEQLAATRAYAVDSLRYEDNSATTADNQSRRVLRLLAEHAALTARAEAAERERDETGAQLTRVRNVVREVGRAIDDFANDAVTRAVYIEQRARLADIWPINDDTPLAGSLRTYLAAEQPAPQPSAYACERCKSTVPHGAEECVTVASAHPSAPGPVDALHPTGKCTCGGEGRCAWCLTHCDECGKALVCSSHDRGDDALRNLRRIEREHAAMANVIGDVGCECDCDCDDKHVRGFEHYCWAAETDTLCLGCRICDAAREARDMPLEGGTDAG